MSTEPCSTGTGLLQENPKIIVLGLGNILMGDDGVGVHIINELQNSPFPGYVCLKDGGTLGLGLVDAIGGYQEVLVIDAVRGENLPDLRFYHMKDISAGAGKEMSLHGLNFAMVFNLMHSLHMEIPEITILGVRIDSIEHKLGLSEKLSQLVPRAKKMVFEKIEEFRRENYDQL